MQSENDREPLIPSNDIPAFFNPPLESGAQMIKKLVSLVFLTIFFPLLSYFASKAIIFEKIFGMSSSNSYFYAAIVAIISVHFVLAIFIYYAFTEGEVPKKKLR